MIKLVSVPLSAKAASCMLYLFCFAYVSSMVAYTKIINDNECCLNVAHIGFSSNTNVYFPAVGFLCSYFESRAVQNGS
jgi:hypothetical protein